MAYANPLFLHISSLRRCGRAFTGDRPLVEAAIAELVQGLTDASCLRLSKVDLYRSYLGVLYWTAWNRQAAVAKFAPLPAQAYWLTVVERFSRCEAAEVLSVSEAELAHLLLAYQRMGERVRPKRIAILEDEFLIAHEIKSIVRRIGHEVSGTARTKSAALQLWRAQKPDLVVSDVLLADGSTGIAAMQECSGDALSSAVFITAYPELLRMGSPEEPLFVLDKPYEPAVVAATIRLALFYADRESEAYPVVH